MNRTPLVDADDVMRSTPGFKLENGVRVVYYQSMSAVLEDVVAKYEAALEEKASWLIADENDRLRERIAELEAQNERLRIEEMAASMSLAAEPDPEPTSGFFNAENMDYLLRVQTHHRQYMIGLENRIADLERAQRESEGEL